MFTLWNLIADLIETNDQKDDNQQQQITDFYAKAATTLPRLACLMQLYFNSVKILDVVQDTLIYVEGDNSELIINENFVFGVQNIIKKQFYIFDKTYLPSDQSNQAAIDPMIIVQKDAVLAAWKWYEHHLNIATRLFTIDHLFCAKPIATYSSMSSQQKTLQQLIMLFDFNIFPLSAVTDKHPVTGQTGILKNRPALGEQALQELMNDGLLKFNYFLTDIRGRNVKSYMKMPIASGNDSAQELYIKNLVKHDINVLEYTSTYEKSSIPSNNNLSLLSLEIFKYNASFVPHYLKYKNQLHDIIQEHLQNGLIRETEEGNFISIHEDGFHRKFHEIENLILYGRQGQLNKRSHSIKLVKSTTIEQTTTSVIQFDSTTRARKDFLQNIVEKECEMQSSSLREISINREDPDLINVTITNEKSVEQALKKAMYNIMSGRSVIYTKTDLTQICNKPAVRLEAIKRLTAANLLQHGHNFWIEPNRTKKDSNKNLKRILRERWLKKGPESESNASKFKFIQILQENANLTYTDYLKTFYPNQEENVFTHNNWTLSDELIQIFESNVFYTQHVKWNVQRYRPLDVVVEELDSQNELQPRLTQVPHLLLTTKRTTDDILQVISQQSNIGNAEVSETINVTATSVRQKRKAQLNENKHEHQIRAQPQRKKN
ncbi:unnamed protein product [Rotaria magnacalcarata]|uniref:Uncharacterized protein n=1 Tax=Rotaria magnacalcarata TaxID=392030 RepID=A0A816Q2G8_9BILA|nr:unnamed protein product [Rotaria magnacalcarata]